MKFTPDEANAAVVKYPREKSSGSNRAKQFRGIHKKADTSIGNVWFADPHKKIGRNSQCPCGSGKKYKKCCGGING